MATIITPSGPHAHLHPCQHPDAAARQRRDRLAAASAADMEAALTFLGMIDPEAFEIALTAVAARADETPGDAAAPRTRSPSRYAASAAPSSGSSSPTACAGSTSAAPPPHPATRRSTTPATRQKSPGCFPARTPKNGSQHASRQCPAGDPGGALIQTPATSLTS